MDIQAVKQKKKVYCRTLIVVTVFLLIPFAAFVVVKGLSDLLGAFKEPDRKIKRVIFITADTVRADAISAYSRESGAPTPNIDRLAEDGILFTNAVSSSPWTLPSLSSIMTGLSPNVHKMTGRSSRLPDNLKTLAEYMLDAGYVTGAVVSNPFLRPKYNLSQGFFEYSFFPRPLSGVYFRLDRLILLRPDQVVLKATTADLTELTVDWLRANSKEDFFLWIHYLDPHGPYTPPPGFIPKGDPPPSIGTRFTMPVERVRYRKYIPSSAEKEWIRKLYGGEVRYVDENVGKVIDELKRLNLYDESLIIFTSDHGEEFWEHGGYEHGHSLYNELLWVPLVVKLPESHAKGKVSALVSTQSIMPTVLSLCGIEYDSDHLRYDSLSALWGANPDSFNEQPVVSAGLLYFEDRESVTFDKLKFIRSLIRNYEELYDLAGDPGERVSILNSSQEKAETARRILREDKEIAKKLGRYYHIVDAEEFELDRETAESLKALGYVQ